MKTLGRPSWPHWLTFSLLIGVALTIVSFLPSLLSSPISRLVIVLPGVLLTGWFHSMTRFVGALGSQFEFMVMICALVPAVFIGLHVFFRWLTRKQTWSKAHRWRVRWTICISGILASGLLVGMASIGVIHQIGW